MILFKPLFPEDCKYSLFREIDGDEKMIFPEDKVITENDPSNEFDIKIKISFFEKI